MLKSLTVTALNLGNTYGFGGGGRKTADFYGNYSECTTKVWPPKNQDTNVKLHLNDLSIPRDTVVIIMKPYYVNKII